MLGAMVVLGCVLVLGGIAAAHVAAFQTHSQMHPAIADLDAIFAHVFCGRGEFHLVEMSAAFRHRDLPVVGAMRLNCAARYQGTTSNRAVTAARKLGL